MGGVTHLRIVLMDLMKNIVRINLSKNINVQKIISNVVVAGVYLRKCCVMDTLTVGMVKMKLMTCVLIIATASHRDSSVMDLQIAMMAVMRVTVVTIQIFIIVYNLRANMLA